MIKKIRGWFKRRKNTLPKIGSNSYTYEHLKRAYELGLHDGRKAGLEVAKQQAARSFSEILRQQNK